MRHPYDPQRCEVDQRLIGPADVKPVRRREATHRGDDLQIDDLRGTEPLRAQPPPRPPAIGSIIDESGDEHARVDHDHRASRSSRTNLEAVSKSASPPFRCSMRSSTSIRVGVSASWRRSARTYPCND